MDYGAGADVATDHTYHRCSVRAFQVQGIAAETQLQLYVGVSPLLVRPFFLFNFFFRPIAPATSSTAMPRLNRFVLSSSGYQNTVIFGRSSLSTTRRVAFVVGTCFDIRALTCSDTREVFHAILNWRITHRCHFNRY